jgi:hypothetical protein
MEIELRKVRYTETWREMEREMEREIYENREGV